MKKKINPPTYFLVLLVLLVAFHFLLPVVQVIPQPVNYLGVIPMALGIVLNLWTDSLFKREGTTVKPGEKPRILVASGPYSISRHPMYLGFFLFLLGIALMAGSIISFVFPIAMFIILEAIFIPLEEENMGKAFGKEYLGYKKKVRRWI